MVTEDIVNFITKYEDGNASEAEVDTGFQLLINSGVVWHLGGEWKSKAEDLIAAGRCRPPQINNPRCVGGSCSLD
jgi:hypothetical protein